MSTKCKWVSSGGVRCNKRARAKFDGYCSTKHQDDGGSHKPKPPAPAPKDGGDAIAKAGGVARLLYYGARLWEIFEDHWPDIFGFLTSEQIELCKQLASRKTDKDRTKILGKIFTSLTPAQWVKLLTVIATATKADRKKMRM